MMDSYQKLKYDLIQQDKRISELHVLIDTLQTNMRSAASYLTDEQKKDVETPSFKWCVNWKPDGTPGSDTSLPDL